MEESLSFSRCWRRPGLAICAGFLLLGCEQRPVATAADPFPILTPPAPATPRINGPSIFGVRPGSPFRYQIPATGERPLEFSARHLPKGLAIDPQTGLITGSLTSRGRHVVRLVARNRSGSIERTLTIATGDQIALTPPMGWNSWNCWGLKVSETKVRAAARELVASGLRDHGWSYVNIDDGWQGDRGGPFHAIQPNQKFPNLPALTNEIHSLGLKVGIYSSPWRITAGRYIGSSADDAAGQIETNARRKKFQYQVPKMPSPLDGFSWLKPLVKWRGERARKSLQRELNRFGKVSFVRQDIRQWAAWQFDYLKYDWVPIDLPHVVEMSRELRATPRDMVYSVSNNAPYSLAPELPRWANAWRTTVDIEDTWASVSDLGFFRDRWAPFNQPGHYNDHDMLVLGRTRWSPPGGCRLTSDEQYTHMSLWCLLSGPLLLGCDLEKLDRFTLGLLTNDEVIAVNQDPLCRQATQVARSGDGVVYAKPLEDGSWAVGLFNRGQRPRTIAVRWSDLGLTAPQAVRDLWRQKDLGMVPSRFETTVAPHGVVLVRVQTVRR